MSNRLFTLSLFAVSLWISQCAGSFMAVGPPGAPPARYMNSTADMEPLIRSLKVLDLEYDILSNLSRNSVLRSRWNSTSSNPRYSNSSVDDRFASRIGNASSTEATDVEATSLDQSYWFLADTKFKHLVREPYDASISGEILTFLFLQQPYAGSANYPAFRNVKDPKYGAVGDGVADDWVAIKKAVTDGDRCGRDCTATSTKGAIIYFPPGKYLITQPIVQYYFTVFIGHPGQRPTILGSKNFKGFSLIDTDAYYDDRSKPDGSGINWLVPNHN
jgi:hypothetical protein